MKNANEIKATLQNLLNKSTSVKESAHLADALKLIDICVQVSLLTSRHPVIVAEKERLLDKVYNILT